MFHATHGDMNPRWFSKHDEHRGSVTHPRFWSKPFDTKIGGSNENTQLPIVTQYWLFSLNITQFGLFPYVHIKYPRCASKMNGCSQMQSVPGFLGRFSEICDVPSVGWIQHIIFICIYFLYICNMYIFYHICFKHCYIVHIKILWVVHQYSNL